MVVSALIALFVLGIAILTWRRELKLLILLFIVRRRITPKEGFAETSPPKAPDYANENSWYPVPNRSGVSNQNAFEDAARDPKPVDVFFVHPTTFLSPRSWNAPIDDVRSSHLVEQLVLPPQAGIFTKHANIYAPRYRQATLASYFSQNANGREALRLAYKDVAAAFLYFISNISNDRPFIIAAHSQGAGHCVRLLKENLDAEGTRDRFIAAYLIGAGICEKRYNLEVKHIPIANSAHQTGCLIAFDTVGPDFKAASLQQGREWDGENFVPREVDGKIIGFNPVTGDKTESAKQAHMGPAYPRYNSEKALAQAYNLQSDDALEFEFLGFEMPTAEKIGARLDAKSGYLVVDRPQRKLMEFPPDAYHLYDYSLFFRDLERDVGTRIKRFLSEN